jgi:hypothetical protein
MAPGPGEWARPRSDTETVLDALCRRIHHVSTNRQAGWAEERTPEQTGVASEWLAEAFARKRELRMLIWHERSGSREEPTPSGDKGPWPSC